MAYDNIKLEKGLYTTGKSFTKALEEIDPSDNYIATELEGLDAYQRQLKRFDIKVSGIGSASCGPALAEKHRLDEKTIDFEFRASPMPHNCDVEK